MENACGVLGEKENSGTPFCTVGVAGVTGERGEVEVLVELVERLFELVVPAEVFV